jgi:hypothetical protein
MIFKIKYFENIDKDGREEERSKDGSTLYFRISRDIP